MDKKRLFLAMQISAPWPQAFPTGRILLEEDRHLTLFFLGNSDPSVVIRIMEQFPDPGFRVGLVGLFDRLLFLPECEPNTAGWHVRLLESKEIFARFHQCLRQWLEEKQLIEHDAKHNHLAHVTIARQPFHMEKWKQAFQPLPLFLKNICLYEGLGFSHYNICWSHEVLPPFEVKEHTADVAFLIRGETIDQLFVHAVGALAFQFPPLIRYFKEIRFDDMDELIFQLNKMIARSDAVEGCPFKAVSHHCVVKNRENILEWEMIVDV